MTRMFVLFKHVAITPKIRADMHIMLCYKDLVNSGHTCLILDLTEIVLSFSFFSVILAMGLLNIGLLH